MKNIFRSILLICFLVAIAPITSCKKDTKDEKPAVVQVFKMERSSYVQSEMAQLITEGLDLQATKYPATIGGKPIELMKSKGSLVFSVPELAPGQYTLETTVGSSKFTCSVTIGVSTTIADPTTFVVEQLTDIEADIAVLKPLVANWPVEKKTKFLADISKIEKFNDSTRQAFMALSPDQKLEVAKIIAANAWWMDEIKTKAQSLKTSVSGLRVAGIKDFELDVKETFKIVEPLADVCLNHLPKLAALITLNVLLPNPISAVAMGFEIADFIEEVMEVSEAHDNLLKKVFLPFQNLFASNGRIATELTYFSEVETPLTIEMDYRSPKKDDRNGAVPIAKVLIEGTDKFNSMYSSLVDISPITLTYNPPSIDEQSTFTTLKKPVHGNYINIGNISNTKVSATTRVSEGKMYVIFKTTETTDQTFSFELSYGETSFGSQTKTLSGVVKPKGECVDIDGNTYQTVQIGTQTWMKENLKTTRYRDGAAIPTGLSDSQWGAGTTGAYAIYDNNAANNTTYGKLYNWYAVTDSRNLCPTGWHIPSDAEWTTLENFLGGATVAGGKMKTTTGWTSPNTAATNESGFSGLPGGYRLYNGTYYSIGYYGLWWSSSEASTPNAWARDLSSNFGFSFRGNYYKQTGFSVRCLRD